MTAMRSSDRSSNGPRTWPSARQRRAVGRGVANVLNISGTTLVFISGVMNFNGTMEPWSSFNSSA